VQAVVEDGKRKTTAIGYGNSEDLIGVRMTVHQLQPGDRIIYSSDGIAKVLSEREINNIVANATTPETAEVALIKTAIKKAGVVDDYGVVVLFYK